MQKWILSTVFLVVNYVFIYGTEFIRSCVKYGCNGGQFNADSLSKLASTGWSGTIIGYMLCINGIRFLSYCVIAGITVLLCRIMKRMSGPVIIMSVAFLAPIVLLLIGAQIPYRFTVLPVLSGNLLFL